MFSDTKYVRAWSCDGLSNCYAIMKIIFIKISFHSKSGLFIRYLCHKNLESVATLIDGDYLVLRVIGKMQCGGATLNGLVLPQICGIA